ncbi:unnamed protein product [Kuraishia capsulata CBS 1993]|uniref:Vacuolar protein sorting-associated protein 29 n=1 Tax=Kuraishia capsulata CBS 1993 TaxID=1382522 RepID=W6MG42_9ASCO|nr:uncharacterized protein KUCA_T00000931001 [Kuraishia capsulata CBS 1993]CDK24964.1 unnamed protein product [Kuraishia capsulata CBS 1993]
MLILAIGDFHIPERAVDLPAKFKKLLSPTGKIQQVLCLGNVSQSYSTLEFLRSISSDLQIVKGEFDHDLSLPLSATFTYDKLKVGIVNGFSIIPHGDPLSLLTQARLMDADILISGGTHRVEAYTLDGKFFINPGSATGAFSTSPPDNEELEAIASILAEAKAAITEPKDEKPKTENTKPDDEGPKENADVKEESKEPESEEPTPVNEQPPLPEPTIDGEKEEGEKPLSTADIEDYLDQIPSFCLLDIQGSVCTLYLYTYIDGDVKVDKVTYRKEEY